MIWYSLSLVFFSILGYTSNNSNIDLFTLFASITILVSSVFLYSERFSERAMQLRQCYIKLDELYSRSKQAEECKDIKSIDEIHGEYSNVLLNVENHIDFDYLCFRYSKRNDKGLNPSLYRNELMKYYYEIGWRRFLVFFLFSIPLIIAWILLTNACIK